MTKTSLDYTVFFNVKVETGSTHLIQLCSSMCINTVGAGGRAEEIPPKGFGREGGGIIANHSHLLRNL